VRGGKLEFKPIPVEKKIEVVYKNGTYKRKSKGFFDRSKQDREKLDEK